MSIKKENTKTPQPSSPFSFCQQFARIIWCVCENTLFRLSPRPFHRWRCFLLRCFGATLGSGVHPYPGMRVWAPWNLYVGDNVGIADGVYLYSMNVIKLGDRTILSQEAFLCAGTHDYYSRVYPLVTKPIAIGSDCWISARVFVHPGVNIADGVVVGACSVVIKSLPPWSVFSGNPCVFIKERKFRD